VNAPLYTTEILRLAASLAGPSALARTDGAAERRSPTCGSSIVTQVMLDESGRIAAISQEVRACAFGQASAALVGRAAIGRSAAEIQEAHDDLADWLAGGRADPGTWPGLTALAPARSKTGRHGAILLPFRALVQAMAR
jgi:NifU-like protein involved in Fe-S cluster formation